MVFFASKHRINKLPLLQRMWMTPVAYALKCVAGAVVFLVDRFNEKVTFEILLSEAKS